MPAVIAELQAVFAEYTEIQSVAIFGSRARGDFKAGSDIDLAVVAPQLSDQKFAMLLDDIEALDLIFKVDLLHWDRLTKSELKAKIKQEGQVFYS